jgi:hypothetical protein
MVYEGSLTPGTADYAEYFEWLDGNPDSEKRYGYFVSLNGNKIEIGNTNLIGIVSVNPSVAGDGAPLKWKNTYLTDEWGEIVYKNYSVYELVDGEIKTKIFIDDESNKYLEPPCATNVTGTVYEGSVDGFNFVEAVTEKVLSPDYDPNVNYTSRSERKEWSPIGLLGKLRVRTSEQITGSTVSASSNGMAVNGNDYHVLENIKDYDGNYGIVKILYYNK